MNLLFILSLSLSIDSSSAQASACHALDFDSYFVAQNAKQNLQKINQTSKPNFAGHFLLLRNEMMMETVYLIADCENGKFAHEKITGDAQFNLNSAEVKVEEKGKPEENVFVWTGERFLKAESPQENTLGSADQASAEEKSAHSAARARAAPLPFFEKRSRADHPVTRPSDQLSLEAQYDALFSEYPVTSVAEKCADPQFDRYFVAQKSKATLIKENAPQTHPNFAGAYRIFRNPSLFGQQILVAQCADGSFFPTTVNGSPKFELGSRLLRAEQQNGFPDLYLWQEGEWIPIPDPVQNKNRTLHQTLNRELSETLLASLGPHRSESISRFQNLDRNESREKVFSFLHAHALLSGRCEKKPRSVTCTVDYQ